MSDLLERLRAASRDDRLSTGTLYSDAADEIERLREEIEQLDELGEHWYNKFEQLEARLRAVVRRQDW